MAVHRGLGPGLGERQYQEALALEMRAVGIPFEREVPLPVMHRGAMLADPRVADFICFGSVVVELKAADMLGSAHVSQVLHYLRASGHRTGLLLNFGEGSLRFRRLVWTPYNERFMAQAQPQP
jgi:GxxExxY protein